MTRYFCPEKVPKPPDLDLFDWSLTKGKKIIIEIGCGSGQHAYDRAEEFPEEFIIAIERTRTKFSQFESLLKNKPPLSNLEAIHADALWWAAANLNPQHMIDHIFILYPNPYPKSKNSNLRFVNMPFMGFILKYLKPDGRLSLATNIEPYFNEAVEGFQTHWMLNLVDSKTLPPHFSPRTLFEKKYLKRGDACFQAIFSK